MIRFVEMEGIHLDNKTKSFGFYNTIDDTFVCLSDIYAFDSVEEYEMFYDKDCGIDKERLDKLIPDRWLAKIHEKIKRN